MTKTQLINKLKFKTPAVTGVFLWLLMLSACSIFSYPVFSYAEPAILEHQLIQQHSRDKNSFTQGLFLRDDILYESSGLYGKSFIQSKNANTLAVINRYNLANTLFAEGLTVVGDTVYTLTWREQTLLLHDAKTLQLKSKIPYRGEGWGLTFDGQHFITSNGSDVLTWRNKNSFKPVKQAVVKLNNKPIRRLNELEFAEGYIWANVWQTSWILAISPNNGTVQGILDLSDFAKKNNHQPGSSVLNGIAYNPQDKTFWITGKLWPNLYQIRINWPDTPAAKLQPSP